MLLPELSVMLGGPEDIFLFFVCHVAHEFCGAACPELAGRHALTGGQERPGGKHAFAFHNRAIHDAGLHPDKAVILHRAGMEDRRMAHGYVVAHGGALKIAGGVDNRAVLNVRVSADAYGVYVAAQDAVVPDIAALPDLHIADDAGRGRDEGGWMDFGHDAAVRENEF